MNPAIAYWAARIILWVIAFLYAYFAFVRVLNITSMGGFDWRAMSLSGQLLDVFYLAVNAAVVYGFVLVRPIGFIAFFVAAISQIAIYIAARPEIAGTPEAIEEATRQSAYLDKLIVFQSVTIVLVLVALYLMRLSQRAARA